MNAPAAISPDAQPSLKKELSLLDAAMLLVGGVIGSGIFLTAGQIATSLRRPDIFILIWIAGGAISLLACFAVAELGGMFPQAGGQYVFLREAYGELPAFLYGWMIFAVVQTGTIAALAVGFAQYFCAVLYPAAAHPWISFTLGPATIDLSPQKLVAVGGIIVLTALNVFGVKKGSILVNISTYLKFAAIAALVLFGLAIGRGDWSHFHQSADLAPPPVGTDLLVAFGVGLIAVLFAFDGWIYVTWAAGEIQDAARAVPRALIIGVSTVAIVYLAINVIYVYALPLSVIMKSDAVVKDAATAMFSARVGNWLALMVAVSCFGAMASAILCTARIFYAMAQDGVFFERMARVHPKFRTPAFSLIAQGVWSAILAIIGLYDQLLTYAIFMMIVSYVATVGALFVLRRKLPNHSRPYRCTGYPVLPAIYILLTSIWTVNTIVARPKESLGGLLLVLIGIPGYFYWSRQRNPAAHASHK
jgi:basic amino acid/polyamine antiporter, APA family